MAITSILQRSFNRFIFYDLSSQGSWLETMEHFTAVDAFLKIIQGHGSALEKAREQQFVAADKLLGQTSRALRSLAK